MLITRILAAFLIAALSASYGYAGTNEGITCIKKGSTKTAEYDKGSNGRDVRVSIKVGNSYKGGSCMGRCGASCGGWAPSAWTKDCLDHDICIRDQGGSNNLSFDTNCGDEFNQAASDYVWGVWRGCRG